MSDVTTAQAVIAYRNELLAGGLPEVLVNEMTRDAASRVIQSQGQEACGKLASIAGR